jgi:hypothetical protein
LVGLLAPHGVILPAIVVSNSKISKEHLQRR